MRLILVPQFPAKLRYQEWWISEFPNNLKDYFDEIIVLGQNSDLIKKNKHKELGELFSPIELSMKFEFEQINEYYNLELYEDDILLCLDVSFPGFFPHVLYHKRPKKAFGFCHATSVNNLDYFSPINFKYNNSKSDSEKAIFKLFNSIFVATDYHKNKLISNNFPKNIITLGSLPNPPIIELYLKENKKRSNIKFKDKENKIVSVSRPSEQKVNIGIEKYVEKKFNTKIIRPNCKSWAEYYDFLKNSKVLLLTGKEDTYGYSIIDAYFCGCNVVAPDDFSYRELINRGDLFDSLESLKTNITNNLANHRFTELLNQRKINDFYSNLAIKMLE